MRFLIFAVAFAAVSGVAYAEGQSGAVRGQAEARLRDHRNEMVRNWSALETPAPTNDAAPTATAGVTVNADAAIAQRRPATPPVAADAPISRSRSRSGPR